MMIHRPATVDDLEAIFQLYMEESGNPYLTYDPMPLMEFEIIYKKLLASETVFVAELEGNITATYRLIPKTDRQAHSIYLGSFTIRKDQQGKGLGMEVLAHIKAIALKQNKSRIELTVDIDNAAAIALYKKAGFHIEGHIRNSYRRSDSDRYYDEYLMGLLL